MTLLRATVLIFVLSILLLSCAKSKTPLPTDNIDELLGTWVNTEYDKGAGQKFGKMVWKADGIVSFCRKSTYDRGFFNPNWIIKEKWKAANGTIYLEVHFEGESHLTYLHFSIRLSPDGSYYERMEHTEELPVEIDANDPAYRIYYRQE